MTVDASKPTDKDAHINTVLQIHQHEHNDKGRSAASFYLQGNVSKLQDVLITQI